MATDPNHTWERDDIVTTWKRFAKIREHLTGCEDNIISWKWIPFESFPIEATDDCTNQIAVKYKNGEIEVLPLSIHGPQIRDYLQIKYFRITHWGILPLRKTSNPKQVQLDIHYIP